MSKYVELRTNVADERYLVEALRELGYQPEVCPEGRPLVGYVGDERAERAHVIIPRRQLDSASMTSALRAITASTSNRQRIRP